MDHIRFALLAFLAAPVKAPPAADATHQMAMMIASFISQIKVNGFASWIIERLKNSKLPALNWISQNTPWVTRAVAVGAASLTAIGIHWTFTGSTLMITGLSLTAIVTTLYNVAQNYLFQHAWYKLAFGGNGVPTGVPNPVGVGGQSPPKQ